MLDHIGIKVSDFARSKLFYRRTLAPLQMTLLADLSSAVTGSHETAGFGVAPKPEFWIGPGLQGCATQHVAFRADSRAAVDAFYSAALEAGGRDNGKPGPRPHYHANYYGAFVLDPDGYNIEAVCRTE